MTALTLAAIDTGPGVRWGGGADIRMRWPLHPEHAAGATIGPLLLMAAVPESPRAPFFLGEAGLGLIGITSLQDDPSLDLTSPYLEVGGGVPLRGGLAVSIGVSLQYVWRHPLRDHKDLVLLGALVGFGFFDPHVAAEDNWFNQWWSD